ncbi:hypothetical protein MMC19_006216 [Ptychographa xylographoides]|nr:hypothetical protein [Ptychographa xylographoides]
MNPTDFPYLSIHVVGSHYDIASRPHEPIRVDPPAILISQRQASAETQCEFQGNPDLYGLGIRVGYYTQAFASWLGNFFVLQESKSLRPMNTLFMFAMFLGLVWISHTPDQTYAIEAFLLLQLLLTTWFVGVKDRSRWSLRYWKYDPMRSAIREISVIAILIYNVWFWWFGLDSFSQTPCGTYIFVFTKVDLYGWFRSAHKVLSIISVCFQTIIAFGDVFQLVNWWQNRTIQTAKYLSDLAEALSESDAIARLATMGSSVLASPTAVHQHVRARSQDRACSFTPCAELSIPRNTQVSHPERPNIRVNPSMVPGIETIQQHTGCGKGTITEADNHGHLPPPPGPLPGSPSPQNTGTNLQAPDEARVSSTSLTFDDIFAAENYVTFVLAPTAPAFKPLFAISILHTSIRITLPSLSCLLPVIPRNFSLRPRLLLPLLVHIYALHTHPFPTYPLLLARAITHPSYITLPPGALNTFLIIRTTSLPRHNRKYYYLPSALMTLFFAISLVLVVELGIVWNAVQGVTGMGTVGQLVPFVLGLGGLVKVGWSWICDGSGDGEGEGKGAMGREVEKCAEIYGKRKTRRKSRGGVEVV